jgi:hypothetical protein
MNITKTSVLTGRTSTIFIEGLTQDMIDDWKGGGLIQIALASIPQELREFVMTGITPQEWSEHLPADDENIDDDYAAAAEAQHESWGDQWLE